LFVAVFSGHMLHRYKPSSASVLFAVHASALPRFTVLFLYFPVSQLLQASAYTSNPFKHVQSSGPVPPASPNEFAVHAVHVGIKLNPILYRLSGQMLHLSPSNANPGADTHAEALALPVCSVVSVAGQAVQLWLPAYVL
jgi:hypothetical protein